MRWLFDQTTPQLLELNGSRSTPILPDHWTCEHVAVCILNRAGRVVSGNVLLLAAWIATHPGQAVEEDTLILLGIGRASSKRPDVRAEAVSA